MKTAFVTGATAGIGEATVRTLVANGWRCVATGRRKERLDALVDELGADKVHAACFDVRDTAAMDAALAAPGAAVQQQLPIGALSATPRAWECVPSAATMSRVRILVSISS